MDAMTKFYILDGHEAVPVANLDEWAKRADLTHRHVGDTMIGAVRVSTVFLGINHNHFGGPPLLFETMVFGGPLNDEQQRYSTWAEAEAGHAAMVARLQATIN